MRVTQTFQGWHNPETFYLAVCLDCGPPPLPVPFTDLREADDWFMAHVNATGHEVERITEIRVDEG